MAHVAKYTSGAMGHLVSHYDRSKDNIGGEVDKEKTAENYNLGLKRDTSQTDFIRQRTGEVQCLKRKDVNVMCDWVVTAPKDLPAADNRKFFEETYKFLSERYGGEKNVVSAYVHMDEKTPHMHFAFVPVVADQRKGIEKVSAKECIIRKDLQTFHGDLEKYLAKSFGREVGILNDATREGNRSIAELKRGQAVEELEETLGKLSSVREGINRLKTVESDLQAKVRGLEGRVLTVKGLADIKLEKTLTGAVKGVSVEQVQDLKKTALQYHAAKEDIKMLKQKYAKLEGYCTNLLDKVPTVSEELAQNKMKIENKDLQRKLQKANEFIGRIPKDVRQQMEQDMKREQRQVSWDLGR